MSLHSISRASATTSLLSALITLTAPKKCPSLTVVYEAEMIGLKTGLASAS